MGPFMGVGGALAIIMEEMGTWEGSGQKRGRDFLGLYRIPHWTFLGIDGEHGRWKEVRTGRK